MSNINIKETIKQSKEHLIQFKKGKYTAELMCHALADSVQDLIDYIENIIEDDGR
jgi:hypothetical protein